MPTKIKSEAEWQAQYDFERLASVEEIKSDPVRLKKALNAGKQMVAEKEKTLKSLKQIVKPVITKPTTKSQGKGKK